MKWKETTVGYWGKGFPYYWREETTGVLGSAMVAFLEDLMGRGPTPSPDQLDLVIRYLQYFIDGPVWDQNPHANDAHHAELAELRKRSRELASIESVRRFVAECIETGRDPL